MAMLMHQEFEVGKTKKALDMLLVDRKNEFEELAGVIFATVDSSKGPIKDWEVFILNFCLDIANAFKTWNGEETLPTNAPNKAITILRQLGRGKSSMVQLTHMMNLSYDLAEQFKVIYKRIE